MKRLLSGLALCLALASPVLAQTPPTPQGGAAVLSPDATPVSPSTNGGLLYDKAGALGDSLSPPGAYSFTGPTISGGTINSSVIGGTTPAAGHFTTGSFTGNATITTASAPTLTITDSAGVGGFLSLANTNGNLYVQQFNNSNFIKSHITGTFAITTGTSDVAALTLNSAQTATFGGALVAPSVTTVGTIAGSVCMTSGNIFLYESGATGCTISRLDLKQDVKPFTYAKAKGDLDRLKPISFAFKSDPSNYRLGFYAENTLAADPRFATYDGNGELQAYDPNGILSAVVAVVKQQQVEIETLKRNIH